MQMPACRITVIKRCLNRDIIDAYVAPAAAAHTRCSRFALGDSFITVAPYEMPQGFCHWAWADIRRDILAICGNAGFPWYREPHMTIAGCTDWFRPVLFKLERAVPPPEAP